MFYYTDNGKLLSLDLRSEVLHDVSAMTPEDELAVFVDISNETETTTVVEISNLLGNAIGSIDVFGLNIYPKIISGFVVVDNGLGSVEVFDPRSKASNQYEYLPPETAEFGVDIGIAISDNGQYLFLYEITGPGGNKVRFPAKLWDTKRNILVGNVRHPDNLGFVDELVQVNNDGTVQGFLAHYGESKVVHFSLSPDSRSCQ